MWRLRRGGRGVEWCRRRVGVGWRQQWREGGRRRGEDVWRGEEGIDRTFVNCVTDIRSEGDSVD